MNISKNLLEYLLVALFISLCNTSETDRDATTSGTTCTKEHCFKCEQSPPIEYRIKLEENNAYLATELDDKFGETFLFFDELSKINAETFWLIENEDSTFSFMLHSFGENQTGLASFIAQIPILSRQSLDSNDLLLLLNVDLENECKRSRSVKMELVPQKGDDPNGQRVVAIRSKITGKFWRWPLETTDVKRNDDKSEQRIILEPVKPARSLGQFNLRLNFNDEDNGPYSRSSIFLTKTGVSKGKKSFGEIDDNSGEKAAVVELLQNDDNRSYSFRLVEESGEKSEETHNGKELFLAAGSSARFVPYRSMPAPFRRFQLVHLASGSLVLRSVATGRYLTATDKYGEIFVGRSLDNATTIEFVPLISKSTSGIGKTNYVNTKKVLEPKEKVEETQSSKKEERTDQKPKNRQQEIKKVIEQPIQRSFSNYLWDWFIYYYHCQVVRIPGSKWEKDGFIRKSFNLALIPIHMIIFSFFYIFIIAIGLICTGIIVGALLFAIYFSISWIISCFNHR